MFEPMGTLICCNYCVAYFTTEGKLAEAWLRPLCLVGVGQCVLGGVRERGQRSHKLSAPPCLALCIVFVLVFLARPLRRLQHVVTTIGRLEVISG